MHAYKRERCHARPRTIWLKNQLAQDPVIFYGNVDGKKRELRITNVTGSSVTGYLVLPGE